MNDLRVVEVLREDKWERVRLASIRKGEQFRFTEDDIEHVYTAASDGFWSDMDGKRTLQAEVDRTNSTILVETE